MRAAIDFGLTNIDVVVQDAGGATQCYILPSAGSVDPTQFERALAATGRAPSAFEWAAVTGGRHRHLPAQIGPTRVIGVDEVTAIGRGGLHLSGFERALVVSAGSGTAMVAARPEGIRHATGSAVGGGTLQGLGRLLLGTADAVEIDALAQKGDSNAVDLTLLEATGGVLGHLPADANAVNFGRVARLSQADPGWLPSREDVAAGLVLMIGQVIAVIAINAARAEGLEHVVVVGHVVDLPSVRRVLQTVAGYYSASITVPELPGFATAIGALAALE
ncbi:MAG: Fumble domain-containing protein [Chloroflexi bacterium]|nr:Fumble domain-containing protein [Chloroflexota bacterium]